MSMTDKAIVLGGVNVKEKDKIVKLFTLENGIISVSMKGVRGDKAKLKYAKELFCFGQYLLEPGKAGYVVTSVDVIDSFFGLSQDIEKYYEACAILDIVAKICVQPNPQLFLETIKALKTLCYDDVEKYYVIDKFLISTFESMGYNFIADKCSSCKATLVNRFLNLEVGELVCTSCKSSTSLPVTNTCYSAIKILSNTDYEKLGTVKLGGNGHIEAFNLLCKNFEWRTDLKVLKIL